MRSFPAMVELPCLRRARSDSDVSVIHSHIDEQEGSN